MIPGHRPDSFRRLEGTTMRATSVGTRWHDVEIAALAGTPAVVMVPKSEHPASSAETAHALEHGRLIPPIETAVGIRDVDRVCGTPGILRVALGNVDLAAEPGGDPATHRALAYARTRVVMASAAAGLASPIDGVTTAPGRPDILAADLEVTRALGFGGKLCIHPEQVGPTNTALLPSDEDVRWARKVLDSAGDAALAVVDNQMIDAPALLRARSILGRVGNAAGRRRRHEPEA